MELLCSDVAKITYRIIGVVLEGVFEETVRSNPSLFLPKFTSFWTVFIVRLPIQTATLELVPDVTNDAHTDRIIRGPWDATDLRLRLDASGATRNYSKI